MTAASSDTSAVLIDYVADWLMQTALSGASVEELFSGFCERLGAAGLPIVRVHLSFSLLHPLYRAAGFTWNRGVGAKGENYPHANNDLSDIFKKSPYYYLLSNNLQHLRRRLDVAGPSEFPVFDDLKSEGITDYLAFVHEFEENSSQGMMGSWATDRADGFSEGAIAAFLRLQRQLAVAIKMAALGKLADNILSTYLGQEVGKRVLSGQIKRGDTETIRAALVIVDMRDSSRVADVHGRQVFIDTLNIFFDAMAAPFNRNGGQILSFLGDGFLAIYPCESHKLPSKIASRAALAAVKAGMSRLAKLNQERVSQDLWEIDYSVGLHVGNVIFGNVGLANRLTFSAFGAAVNATHRLESLNKKYPAKIFASQAFVGYCGGKWDLLGTETLRGFEEPVNVYTAQVVDLDKFAGEPLPAVESEFSAAEHLMRMRRTARETAGKAPAE